MKKAIALLLSVILTLVVFSGCNNTSSTETTENTSEESTESTSEETTEYLTDEKNLVNDNYSSKPFVNIEETDASLSKDELQSIISNVPCDKYEVYPDLHNVPLTATLYKNGEVISINVGDNRLIGMMNLYNNALYNMQYGYSQGLLNIETIEEVKNEEFRLVLTYTQKEVTVPRLYYETVRYDTIIITNDYFYVFAHDQPGYEGEEDRYPFFAMLHAPLFNNDGWLDLFGF
ncbi:MAG: hypothetical protein E7589_04090 [Ruminococcaceae bacterium]|nr:hypothetical protein [Oscillospiraceae bacterium]